MKNCQKPNFNGQCCCNCKNHLEDLYHCTTSPKPEGYDKDNHTCVCSTHKGWICYLHFEDGTARAHSNWGEHGMCEMWTRIEPREAIKVSFDYDNTLDHKSVQKYALKLIKRGVEVWITTTRMPETRLNPVRNIDLYATADKLGIPKKHIVFTGYLDKYKRIKYKDFLWHLDDDPQECELINENTDTMGITKNHKHLWKKQCENLLLPLLHQLRNP